MNQPNILFMHSHNTGRYIEPYGHAIPTPNLMRLAREGVVFRQAYSAAPTCSPSRGSFLTGTWPHCCGMLGLAHRGFAMPDYRLHLAQFLKEHGYATVVSGVDHTAPALESVGYTTVLSADDTNYPTESREPDPATAASEYLNSKPRGPFFLSVGLNETHRPFPTADSDRHPAEDRRYSQPVRPFPDTPETRADAADLKAAVRIMDAGYGRILDALDSAGLADSTYVFCFTDHGLQFPRNMCNLTIHGTGVYLIARGPDLPSGEVSDALVSLIDLFPTVCELAGIAVPDHVDGVSIMPLLDGRTDKINDYVFGEVNYHAAYEPTRSVRNGRYNLIKRFDNREHLVLSNVDDTPSKEFLLAYGWEEEPRDQIMLYDDVYDPDETRNLADGLRTRAVRTILEELLDEWMRATNDPLIKGAVNAPKGARVNNPDGRSAKETPEVIP